MALKAKAKSGAPSTGISWGTIEWHEQEKLVHQLQMMKWSAPTLQAPKGGTLNTASKEPKW